MSTTGQIKVHARTSKAHDTTTQWYPHHTVSRSPSPTDQPVCLLFCSKRYLALTPVFHAPVTAACSCSCKCQPLGCLTRPSQLSCWSLTSTTPRSSWTHRPQCSPTTHCTAAGGKDGTRTEESITNTNTKCTHTHFTKPNSARRDTHSRHGASASKQHATASPLPPPISAPAPAVACALTVFGTVGTHGKYDVGTATSLMVSVDTEAEPSHWSRSTVICRYWRQPGVRPVKVT